MTARRERSARFARRPAPALALLLALAAAAGAPGCDRGRGGGARELDDTTIAVLNTARALHHEADVYESAGDFGNATHAVERILALRIPASVEEAEDIRVDAWGRLGEIALSANDPDAALAHANSGLRDAHRESVLTARLQVVRGRALRMLADRARAAGDAAGAEARRREAIDALETSIQINQRVLRNALDGGTL